MKDVDEYLTERVHQKNTQKIYRRDLEQFRIFLGKDLREAKEEEFEKYFSKLSEDLQVTSLRRKQSVIRKFYQYLLLQRKIDSNPFPLVKLKKWKGDKITRLSAEQYQEILEKINQDFILLTKLLWETGAKILDLYDVKVKSLYEYSFQKVVGMRQGKVYSYSIPLDLQEEFKKQAETKEKEDFFFQGNRQIYDKELKKIHPEYSAAQIKKTMQKGKEIPLERIREHYFKIGIGDRE